MWCLKQLDRTLSLVSVFLLQTQTLREHECERMISLQRVHLVCNAHLDPVWLWEWEEGAAEAISTFRVAADLCEEYPVFVFNHNEAILYKWVEEYEPSLFARIQ